METEFHKHGKKQIKQYANDVVKSLENELTVEQVNQINSIADNAFDLVKPDVVLLFQRMRALITKYMSIPDNVSTEESSILEMNTPELDTLEENLKAEIAELDEVYLQQYFMIEALTIENEFYDDVLIPQAEIDSNLCDHFEGNLSESNFDNAVATNVMEMLEALSMEKGESVGSITSNENSK